MKPAAYGFVDGPPGSGASFSTPGPLIFHIMVPGTGISVNVQLSRPSALAAWAVPVTAPVDDFDTWPANLQGKTTFSPSDTKLHVADWKEKDPGVSPGFTGPAKLTESDHIDDGGGSKAWTVARTVPFSLPPAA